MAFLIITAGIIILIVAFVMWRVSATASGSRGRVAKVIRKIQPIIDKLESKEPLNPDEISSISDSPETRIDLYQLLEFYKKSELFPKKHLSNPSIGEAALAYWLLHPNESGKVPSKIEYISTIMKKFSNNSIEYLVYRFFDDDGQWKVGIAGPFFQNSKPYSGYPGTFSTFELFDSKTPEEHVDWVHNMMIKKNMYRNFEN